MEPMGYSIIVILLPVPAERVGQVELAAPAVPAVEAEREILRAQQTRLGTALTGAKVETEAMEAAEAAEAQGQVYRITRMEELHPANWIYLLTWQGNLSYR
jgi:hypothetical protein